MMKRLCGAAVLVLLASGCGQGGKTPASSSGPGTANVGPAVASQPLSTPASAPGAPACKSGDLALNRINEDAGAGHRVVTYGVVNNGPAACTLTGYPTLTLIDADGRRTDAINVVQTDQAFYNVGGPAQPVTLAPSGKGVFFLSFAGIQATDKPCIAVSKLDVTPPGNTQSIELSDTLQICTGEARLSPIRPNQGAVTGGNSGQGAVFY